MVSPSSRNAWQNSKESLANIRFVTFGAPLHMEIPLIRPSDSALFSSAVKPSAHNKNRYGDNGSPWRIPLEGWIMPNGFPLIRIEKDGVVTQLITLSIQSTGNPNFSIIL